MRFHVGQKVVCIESSDSLDEMLNAPGDGCVLGSVYTIANIFIADGDVMLEFVELRQPGDDYWYPGFDACFFRPVIERKTDISIFEKLLTPSGIRKAKKELV